MTETDYYETVRQKLDIGHIKHPKHEKFYELIKALHSIGVLSFSKRINQTLLKSDQKNLLNYKFYFMAINPKQLKAIVDAIFNKF